MTVRQSVFAGVLLASTAGMLAGCDQQPPDQRHVQSDAAQRAANSVRFSGNAEIDNIKRRLEITSDPTLLGYIVLFNEAGAPILYEGVRGKVTSGSKRLTPTEEVACVRRRNQDGSSSCEYVRTAAPSDEGTYGSSNPYIFYWSVDGVYRQWSGPYIYSTQPIRLNAEPLIVQVAPPPPPANQRERTAPPRTDAPTPIPPTAPRPPS